MGGMGGMVLPGDTAAPVRQMISQVSMVISQYGPPTDDSDAVANIAEQKAQALVCAAAGELAKMPDAPERKAIIEKMAEYLAVVVNRNDRANREANEFIGNLTITEAGMEHLVKEGIAEEIEPLPLEVTPPSQLAYLSTGRGLDNPHGERERVYYGKVYRWPQKETANGQLDKIIQEIEEGEVADLFKLVDDKNIVTGGERAAGEAIERYETFDIETREVIVLWRIPFRATDTASEDPTDAR